MDVGPTIREARLRASLTQAELAERSGTSQATLSAYEGGHKTPSAETLDRVLAAAGVRLAIEQADRPVLAPGPGRLQRLGQTLAEVIELAAELPTRHAAELAYPRLPPARGGST